MKPKNCKQCGRFFSTVSASQHKKRKFCGSLCASKWVSIAAKKKQFTYTRTCVDCETIFTAKHQRIKRCNHCYKLYNKKTCLFCGRTFGRKIFANSVESYTRWESRKYCGPECRNQAPLPPITWTCVDCNAVQTTQSSYPPKRCKACKKIYKRQLTRDWAKNNPDRVKQNNDNRYKGIQCSKEKRIIERQRLIAVKRAMRTSVCDSYVKGILKSQGIDVSCLSEEAANGYIEIRRKLIKLNRLRQNV